METKVRKEYQERKENQEEEKKKLKAPTQPLSFVYADCKQQTFQAVRQIFNNYRLPLFMAEGILESIMSEYRHEAYLELAAESTELKLADNDYLEEKLKESQEEHDREMERLIADFEAGPKKEPNHGK